MCHTHIKRRRAEIEQMNWGSGRNRAGRRSALYPPLFYETRDGGKITPTVRDKPKNAHASLGLFIELSEKGAELRTNARPQPLNASLAPPPPPPPPRRKPAVCSKVFTRCTKLFWRAPNKISGNISGSQ